MEEPQKRKIAKLNKDGERKPIKRSPKNNLKMILRNLIQYIKEEIKSNETPQNQEIIRNHIGVIQEERKGVRENQACDYEHQAIDYFFLFGQFDEGILSMIQEKISKAT